MNRYSALVLVFLFSLYQLPISNASIHLIPNVLNPQDAVDVAVLIPEAGVRLAMVGYSPDKTEANFVIVNGSDTVFEFRDNVRVGEDLELIPDCMTAVIDVNQAGIELAVSCAHPYIVILANSIDYNVSAEFITYLEGRGVEVVRASAIDFGGFKEAQTIVILGGPDAPFGVGGIASEVLAEDEQEFLRSKGNLGVFVHDNPWRPKTGRSVIVLAGSDRHLTRKAGLGNKELFIS